MNQKSSNLPHKLLINGVGRRTNINRLVKRQCIRIRNRCFFAKTPFFHFISSHTNLNSNKTIYLPLNGAFLYLSKALFPICLGYSYPEFWCNEVKWIDGFSSVFRETAPFNSRGSPYWLGWENCGIIVGPSAIIYSCSRRVGLSYDICTFVCRP